MSDIKKILLFGATGRLGRLIMLEALARGFEIVALVRSPEKIATKSPSLLVARGTPENKSDVAKAFEDCDAILSALNNNRASDMPWAKLINPPYLMRDSVQNGLEAMKAAGKKRIVVVTAMGAGDSLQDISWLLRPIITKTNLAVTYRDHDAQEELLKSSNMDWTIVRPVALTNKDETKKLIVSYRNKPKPARAISRKHVAKFVLNCLAASEYIHKTPMISEK
jgi:putative NADH-flavin reductase